MALSRRSFLKQSTAASAAAALTGGIYAPVFGRTAVAMTPGPGNKWPGRVVVNFNKGAATLSTSNTAVIKTMVDDSIKRLTDKTDLGEAWKAIFPSTLSATSKVAIKVALGCAQINIAPHWSLVKAITDGLQLMDFNGTKILPGNITIFDMRCSNKISEKAPEFMPEFGYTAANFPGINRVRDSEGKGYTDGFDGKQYATSLNAANFLINVFRPGGHDTYAEGLTLGFKNHYGTYPTNHNNATAPGYLRDINCVGPVYKKNVLSVCAGIFGAKEASGSPGSGAISYATYAKSIDPTITAASVPPTTIIMSTDPVTAEMQCIKIMRLNVANGKFGVANMPKYLRASGGVEGVLTDKTYNIGVIDEANMDIRRIINGTTTTGTREMNQSSRQGGTFIAASPLGQDATFIEYSLTGAQAAAQATIAFFNMKGVEVCSFPALGGGVVNHFSWNHKDKSGQRVSGGVYLVRISTGATNISARFSVLP